MMRTSTVRPRTLIVRPRTLIVRPRTLSRAKRQASSVNCASVGIARSCITDRVQRVGLPGCRQGGAVHVVG
jgi:hypothetical protein